MVDEYSVEDELTRKAGEAALWLENEINRGALTKPQAYSALITFDMITLGLIDPAFGQWARENRELVQSRYPDKVVMGRFESDGKETFITVELNRNLGKVTVTQISRNPSLTAKIHTFEEETDQITAACKGYFDIIERLKSKGLVVVA